MLAAQGRRKAGRWERDAITQDSALSRDVLNVIVVTSSAGDVFINPILCAPCLHGRHGDCAELARCECSCRRHPAWRPRQTVSRLGLLAMLRRVGGP